MPGSVAPAPSLDDVRAEAARRELDRRRAAQDPAWFLDHVRMVDEQKGETFRFHLRPTPENEASGWHWQADVISDLSRYRRNIYLKARQLGLTWTVAAYGCLWLPLYKQGALSIIYRQTEHEAGEILERVWDMYQSLPEHLRNGAKVIAPTRGARPSSTIEWEFPDGRISRVVAMASTSRATRGKTVAFALLDEFAYIDQADEIMKAVQPAVGQHGSVAIVSTANGRGNLETGEGNYFYYLWEKAEETGFHRRFLPWDLHPDRDQHWYDTSPEVRGLRPHERAAEYPADEHEAFTLTERGFFDADALRWYAQHLRQPSRRFDFERVTAAEARIREHPGGRIHVYLEPLAGHAYAIGADIATGRGGDYTSAHVLDLATMEIAADYHGKVDADLFAYQLHYLGRWFNTAWIAPEVAGGYGEAVIIPLRDGREGRPAYPKLYRHTEPSSVDERLRKSYGFPTNLKTRPLLFGNLEKAIREHHFPYLTDELLYELESVVEGGHPTPAARQGANDDRVISLGIALELYRRYGRHPDQPKQKPSRYKPQYPWQESGPKPPLVPDKFRVDAGTVDRDGQPIRRRRRSMV